MHSLCYDACDVLDIEPPPSTPWVCTAEWGGRDGGGSPYGEERFLNLCISNGLRLVFV